MYQATTIRLKNDIIAAAAKHEIDPYRDAFAPRDLKLKSEKYGSFADFCDPKKTKSGKWKKDVILEVVDRDKIGRPKSYKLIKK